MKSTHVARLPGKKTGLRLLWALIENEEPETDHDSGNGEASAPGNGVREAAERTPAGVMHPIDESTASASWRQRCFHILENFVKLVSNHHVDVKEQCGVSGAATASGASELLIIVTTSCRSVATGTGSVLVNDVENSFETHEFAAIRQRIEEVYQPDIVSLTRRFECMNDTIILNLTIDSFGCVDAAVLHPGTEVHPMYNRELEAVARQWRFPAILRHGACCVLISGHPFGQRTTDGDSGK